MWFDVSAVLAEIEGGREAAPETPNRKTTATATPVRVAEVASVATPPTQDRKATTAPSDASAHGLSVGGRPLTWTGRVVSLDDWRSLTEWQRHGPKTRSAKQITLPDEQSV